MSLFKFLLNLQNEDCEGCNNTSLVEYLFMRSVVGFMPIFAVCTALRRSANCEQISTFHRMDIGSNTDWPISMSLLIALMCRRARPPASLPLKPQNAYSSILCDARAYGKTPRYISTYPFSCSFIIYSEEKMALTWVYCVSGRPVRMFAFSSAPLYLSSSSSSTSSSAVKCLTWWSWQLELD